MYESSYREPPPYERAYHLSYQSSYILVLVPSFAYEKSFGRYENVGKSIFVLWFGIERFTVYKEGLDTTSS